MHEVTLEPWRWYTRVEEPSYRLDHWWLKPVQNNEKKPEADLKHPLLVRGDVRGRPQIQAAPWLWEILRRHPDFRPVLETFRSQVGSYPDPPSPTPEAATSAFDAWNTNRVAFLNCWEGRGAIAMGALAEFAHLTWADLHPSPEPGVFNDQGSDPLDDVLGIPLRFREGVRATFESGLHEFLRYPGNNPVGGKLLTSAVITVPQRPAETDGSQFYYRHRQDFGIKRFDDFTLGEFRTSAEKRSRSLLFLEFDDGASVEVLAKAIRDHLKTVKKPKPGKAVSAQPGMRLRSSSLELLARLDRWQLSKTDSNCKLTTAELNRIIASFSKIKLA